MNFFIKPPKPTIILLCQRYSYLNNLSSRKLIQRKRLLYDTINKETLVSSAQCGFHSCTVNKKEMSLREKVLSEGLSALKSVDLKQLKGAPFTAIVYGFGGIIPFVFPPVYFILGSYSPILVTSQLMYGATILAFVGGVKWGNAVAKNDISHFQIGISTIPSLVAWSSLLVPEPVGLLVVSTGLLGALYIDLLSSDYPSWFIAMRTTLTGIAVTSLLTSMMFYLFH